MTLSVYLTPHPWKFIKEQARQYAAEQLSLIPLELIHRIFSELLPKDLFSTVKVCKNWSLVASNQSLWDTIELKNIFPSLKYIDKTIWETHLNMIDLAFENRPLNKRKMISRIQKILCSLKLEPHIQLTYITIPMNHSLFKLKKLAMAPIKGHATDIHAYLDRLPKELVHVPSDKTLHLIMADSILFNTNLDSHLPTVLSMTTLAILTYVSSGKFILNRMPGNLPTYTYCSDTMKISSSDKRKQLVVGNHSCDGIQIELSNFYKMRESSRLGIAPMWDLESDT